ncbi:electron transfer flavoprotein subunit alpha/FixB family protein [Chloroflexota bacterium]
MSQEICVLIEHNQGKVAEISYVMLAAGRQVADKLDSQLVAVLFGHEISDISKNFTADKVIYVDHPALDEFTQDAYLPTMVEIIKSRQPRIVLFGNTTIGSDLASSVSIKLGLDLANSCKYFSSEGNYVSQICGGKIMVEGSLSSGTMLLTMVPGGYKPEDGTSEKSPSIEVLTPPDLDNLKLNIIKFIQPESSDIDISKESILVSVGRGIQTQDNLELAENLANALGGVVCASRPVIDQGWLPASRLVGKSGKSVNPKLYLALGISGAPEHVETIGGSEMIIAINTDPNAPIFDIAKYGTETDLFDLVELLTEKVEQLK